MIAHQGVELAEELRQEMETHLETLAVTITGLR